MPDARAVHVVRQGYTTAPTRGVDTAARARARRRGSCRCEQRPDPLPIRRTVLLLSSMIYWFTLEVGTTYKAARLPPCRRPLTACVIAGCVSHTSVHSDKGPRAWGSGGRARCVEQQH